MPSRFRSPDSRFNAPWPTSWKKRRSPSHSPMPTVLGQPLNRVDGRRKVTGRAGYAADQRWDGLLHAYGVMSTVASGEIIRLDAGAAEKAPGVLAVYHADNFPKTSRVKNDFKNAV